MLDWRTIFPSKNSDVKTYKVLFNFVRGYATEIKMKILNILIRKGSNS